MAKKEEAPKKVKRPTALKRNITNNKKRLVNKVFKSTYRTTLNKLEDSIKANDTKEIESNLSEAFSILDKGVKRGIYKQNKANRTKSRLLARTK